MVNKLRLLMGKPLVVNEESNISVHQPTMSEISDIGEDGFNELILPFVLSTELVFRGIEKEEELAAKFHIFELFFIEMDNGATVLDGVLGGKDSLDTLVESLKYFMKTDDVRILRNRQKLVVDSTYLIDNEEFDKIRKVIQGISNRNEVEVEKPPKNMSERQKDIWRKLQNGRKRSAEKNALHLQDIINYVSFGGNSYISMQEIAEMTYYQLQNAYKSIIGKDAYAMSMGYKLSQKFDVKDDVKHWTETLKIGK